MTDTEIAERKLIVIEIRENIRKANEAMDLWDLSDEKNELSLHVLNDIFMDKFLYKLRETAKLLNSLYAE